MTDFKKMYEDMKDERDQLLLSINKINDDQMNLPPIAHTIDKLNQEYDNLDNEYNNMKIKYNKIKIQARNIAIEKNTIIERLIETHLENCWGDEDDITFFIDLPDLNTYKLYGDMYNCNIEYIRELVNNTANRWGGEHRYDNFVYEIDNIVNGRPYYEITIKYFE